MVLKILLVMNVFFSTMVIFCNSLLHVILSFILVIFSSSCFLLIFKVEFLAFIFLLVYIGAVTVLFLFVIMMLNLNILELEKQNINMVFCSSNLLYFVIFAKSVFFCYFFNKKLCVILNFFCYEFIESNELISFLFINNSLFFLELFTVKFSFFILVGVILLFAMIGSISLCLRQKNL